MGDAGPFAVRVDRNLANGKNVCTFNFVADSYFCKGRGSNCCRAWAWQQPRFSNSDFQPALQTRGHNCRVWYLATLGIVQSIYAILVNTYHSVSMYEQGCFNANNKGESHVPGCKSACTPGECKKRKCQWMPNKREDPARQKGGWTPKTWNGPYRAKTERKGSCWARRV